MSSNTDQRLPARYWALFAAVWIGLTFVGLCIFSLLGVHRHEAWELPVLIGVGCTGAYLALWWAVRSRERKGRQP